MSTAAKKNRVAIAHIDGLYVPFDEVARPIGPRGGIRLVTEFWCGYETLEAANHAIDCTFTATPLPKASRLTALDTAPSNPPRRSFAGSYLDPHCEGEPTMTTATKTTIELYYASTLHETMPFDNVPGDGIEYIDDFDSIEDAARWADVNRHGWYLYSTPERGIYLGTICVMQKYAPRYGSFDDGFCGRRSPDGIS